MRAIEREADEQGWGYAQMMEQAGLGLAEVVHSFYGYLDRLTALGLVGPGNNGGDTLVALSAMAEVGWEVRAYLVKPREKGDPLVERVRAAGGRVESAGSDADFTQLDEWLQESSVLLDGVLGTGIQLPLKGEAAKILRHVKASAFCPPVVAVDCPSGVDCDSGLAAEETLEAEVTVCMAAIKTGLLRLPAHQFCSDLQVVEIGLPQNLAAWVALKREVLSEERVREMLPMRPPDGHKGTFGTLTFVGGSLNYSGAVLLAVGAAGKIGAGLVQAAVPAPLHAALAGADPNPTWILLPHQMGAISGEAANVLLKALDRSTAMLVGPGFGLEDCSTEFLRRLLEGKQSPRGRGKLGFVSAPVETSTEDQVEKPLPAMIVDADGLKLLARIPDWAAHLPAQSILTPHPGEMAVLTGQAVEEIQANRLETASKFAQQWGHVVVLKGAFTVIAAPDGRVGMVPVASSALAHAGTGDVLAGMIGGLRAQGLPAFDAAAAGAWLHAQAGLAAAGRVGHEAAVQASDLLDSLPEVLGWVWN
jgi:NAD(P)H-hydrate epimerase